MAAKSDVALSAGCREAIGHHLLANVPSQREGVLFLFSRRVLGNYMRREESTDQTMLSPSDIRPAVREVLLSTTNSLASYQILDRLPTKLRDQLITERGMPGAGSGNSYSAASVVTDAVEGVLPSLNPPYRVYLDVKNMTFEVAGQVIRPGNNAIAFYNLPSGEVGNVAGENNLSVTAKTTPTQWHQSSESLSETVPLKSMWYDKSGWLWFWAFAFWPLAVYGVFRSSRVSPMVKYAVSGSLATIFLMIVISTMSAKTKQEALPIVPYPDSVRPAKPAPRISQTERVNQALARSKQFVADRRYEEGLGVLRDVKLLAPDKVVPQMTKVKQIGAASLTRTAKEIRSKNPSLALDMLSRASTLGGMEATRLIPRVRREVAAEEKRLGFNTANTSEAHPELETSPVVAPSPVPKEDTVGIFIIKEDFFGAFDPDDLDRAIRYGVQKDYEALQKALNSGDVFALKPGVRVRVMAHRGFLAPVVKVRPLGETDEFWVVREAIKQGW